MENINTRISKLITALGLSKNQFSKEIGTSSAMISNITGDKTNFGIEIIEKIVSKYPQLNFNWILTGIGDMWIENHNYKPQVQPQLLNNLYDDFPDTNQFKSKAIHKRSLNAREIYILENNEEKIKAELNDINSDYGFLFSLLKNFELLRDISDDLSESYFTDVFNAFYNSHKYLKGKEFDYESYKNDVYKSLFEYKDFINPLSKLLAAFSAFCKEIEPIDKKKILNDYKL